MEKLIYKKQYTNEIEEYYDILCGGNYPQFINKYLKTPQLKRISNIGIFCGGDYIKLHNIRYPYSRLQHSIATALMTWHFTKDKTQTICALFHDAGTPCFSHCIDYLLNDSKNQESSEKNLFEIMTQDEISDLSNLLKQDSIDISDLSNMKQYTIVENKRPKLCVDRLDGIFCTNLFWTQTSTLEEIKKVYSNMIICKNEFNEEELGFQNADYAVDFFNMVYSYSIGMQENKDKYYMQYVADSVKSLLDKNIIKFDQLYTDKETDILKLLEKNIDSWKYFSTIKNIDESDIEPKGYFVSIESKKRYVDPICINNDQSIRLSNISSSVSQKIDSILNYKTKKYAFVEKINEI